MTRALRINLACSTLLGSACAIASAQPEPAAAPPSPAVTNALCPVMTDEPVDPDVFVDYQGQRVYLCCRRCLTKFVDDPEAYVVNLASFNLAQPLPESQSPPPPASQDELAPDPAPSEQDTSQGQQTSAPAHDAETAPDLLPYLGRFHPSVVHFPIALLIVGALFELFAVLAPNSRARTVARACLALGALSAVLAAALGLANALDASYSTDRRWIFWWHRLLGLATAAFALIAWIAFERRRLMKQPGRAGIATLLIVLCAALVAITGHFGGSLVFGWDYLFPD